MEISIKTGDGIRCDYTGEDAKVLVRLEGAHVEDVQFPAPIKGVRTGWLSRKALEDALRVIGSLDGGPSAAQPSPQFHVTAPHQSVAHEPPAVVPQPQIAPPNMEAVQNLDRELVRMIKQAEQEGPEDGKKKGVREIEIRELIAKHKPVFGSSGAAHMFRVLNHHIGMQRDRFDLIWAQKPERDFGDDE